MGSHTQDHHQAALYLIIINLQLDKLSNICVGRFSVKVVILNFRENDW